MGVQIIRTPEAPTSPLFGQAIGAGSNTFVSGIVGIDSKTRQLAGLSIQEQTRQALVKCVSILRAVAKLRVDLPNVLVSIAEAVGSACTRSVMTVA